MLREYFERRRIRKVFSKLVSPEVIDKILDPTPVKIELQERQIGFICVAVRGETAQLISERMGFVCDLAAEHGAITHDLISGLVIISYGMVETSDSFEKRSHLCAALIAKLGDDVKAVHGSALGHCGMFGSGMRLSFGFTVLGFLEALGTLAALPFGEIQQV